MPRIVVMFAHLVMASVMVCGCQPVGSRSRGEVVITPPAAWRRVAASTWLAPGKPLAAWAGPEGASLVLYQSLPAPGATAKSVASALANRLDNLKGFQVIKSQVLDLAVGQAARVDLVAPGTGDALAPSGSGTPYTPPGKTLVPTRQVTVAFVRPDGVYFLAWHAPDAVFSRIEPDLQATLTTVQLAADGQPGRYTQD